MDPAEEKPSGADIFQHAPKLNMDLFQPPAPPPPPDNPPPTPPPPPSVSPSSPPRTHTDRPDPFARIPEKQERARRAKDTLIPIVLILAAWAVIDVQAYLRAGSFFGALVLQGYIIIFCLAQVLFTLVTCLLTAGLVGAAMGRFGSAFLRVAAATVFPWAVGQAIPYLGLWFFQPVLVWILLAWFFDLDPVESFIWTIMVSVVQIGIIVLIGTMGLMMAFQKGLF